MVNHNIYFLKINDLVSATEVEKMLTVISKEKLATIMKLKFQKDKKLKLYSEVIIRYLASQDLQVSNSCLHFNTTEFGKPYLKDYPEWQFNLSHTKNAILVGVSSHPIGVDIEFIDKKSQDFINIAKRFFLDSEFNYIIKCPHRQVERFFEVWTKKEAYLKYTSLGLTQSLSSFDVLSEEVDQKLSCWQKDEYMMSVCSESKFTLENMVELSEFELMKMASALQA